LTIKKRKEEKKTKKMSSNSELISLSLDTVRMHNDGRASVLDFTRILTGCTAAEASASFRRLLEREPSLKDRVGKARINGLGRETPVADSQSLFVIGMLLTGQAASQVREMAASVLNRALSGDAELVEAIERRRATMSDAERRFFQPQSTAALTTGAEESDETDTEEEEDETDTEEEEEEEYKTDTEEEDDIESESESDSSATVVLPEHKATRTGVNRKRKAKEEKPVKEAKCKSRRKSKARAPGTPSRRKVSLFAL
jgi:hypothetical protein